MWIHCVFFSVLCVSVLVYVCVQYVCVSIVYSLGVCCVLYVCVCVCVCVCISASTAVSVSGQSWSVSLAGGGQVVHVEATPWVSANHNTLFMKLR